MWETEEAFGRFFGERLQDALLAAQVPEFDPPRFHLVHNLLVA